MRRTRFFAALVTAVLVLPSTALAHHPDHPTGREDFPGEGVVDGLQHGTNAGHLPAVNRNVQVVGRAEVTNPSGASNDGRVADVFGYKDYAYLNAFRDPTCVQTGVHVIDIHDPANPFEVPTAFIPTSVGSFVGEGIQVITINNAFFSGDLLIHQNENCPFGPPPASAATAGGISMWNVTNPTSPVPVKLHAGDFTNPSGGTDAGPNQTHSMYAWTNEYDGRTYVSLIDDEEVTDVDILDITDPFNPVLVNDTLDLEAPPFNVGQPTPENLRATFSHDMHVYKVGQRYVMNMNYWDGGYVLLDVTNPRPGQVSLIAESDYAALDEERLARGQRISPEGNGHQSELSPNRKFLIGTDEDFGPYRVIGLITSGPYTDTEYTATSANATPPVSAAGFSGTPTFVGFACNTDLPLPPPGPSGIALIERGGAPAACGFQEKLNNITTAGYTAGIVFNNVRSDCLAQVTMAASGTIPFVFANRANGLRLLQVAGVTEANACTTASPATGSAVASTSVSRLFDGWGYVRLFETNIPHQRGAQGSIRNIDTYAVPESQLEAYATGAGTLSVHEVAMDPAGSLAYISYYDAGFRVVKYGKNGIEEVGAFIDEGGNDFWGVEIWNDENGEQYVLASDRDFGLYVFRYSGPTP